jgi:hypothetical protein
MRACDAAIIIVASVLGLHADYSFQVPAQRYAFTQPAPIRVLWRSIDARPWEISKLTGF